jgi:hypothetical protein
MDYGLWTMDYGLWTMDYGLWTMDQKLFPPGRYHQTAVAAVVAVLA